MTRGGARDGAGRNSELDASDRLAVGARCDEVQAEAAMQEGEEIYEAQAHIVEVRKLQERLKAIQPKLVPRNEPARVLDQRVAARRDELVAKVGKAFSKKGEPIRRSVTKTGVRTLTRIEICKKVARQFGITPRQVETYWKEYRSALKRVMDELDKTV